MKTAIVYASVHHGNTKKIVDEIAKHYIRICKNNKIKEENIMGLFDINDEKLQALYHRALVEANYGFVNPRKYPYLDRAIMQYSRENGCSYDQALILAKTGNKMF